MMSYKMARRSFLRGCGGSAALLVPLLRSIESRAQGMKAPLRLLIIHRPLGTQLDLWRPAATATTTNFVLPMNAAPFEPLRSKMVMIDGLNVVPASRVAGGNSGGNSTAEGGLVAAMTGVPTLGPLGQQDHAAGGPSIDQLLLARSPALGGPTSTTKTAFQSLQVAADVRADRDEVAPRVLSYLPPLANADINMARQPLFPVTQPLAAFSRLFAGALPSGSDMATNLAQEISVLDFMRADLSRLEKLVPASEKPKLLAHADSIRQLEISIRASVTASPRSCAPPAMPPNFPQTGTGYGQSRLTGVDYYDPNDATNHPHQALGRLHLAIIKTAFQCDLLRVATFSWASATSWVYFPTTFDGATLPSSGPANPHNPPLSVNPLANPAIQGWAAAIDRFYSRETSLAIQEFAATPDLDGKTLLDNTVIPYISEQGRRWDHSLTNVPLLVFGGDNTRLKGGTFLKVNDGHLPMQTGPATVGGTGNRPFNDFWLALMPIFGVTLTALGTPAQYTGALPGLVG